MKWLLLFAIRLYWICIPEKNRRRCIFKESCSHYVYRHTIQRGFWYGLKRLSERKSQCCQGYELIFLESGEIRVRLADGTCVPSQKLSAHMNDSIELAKGFFPVGDTV